jgi:hypothetical protein
VRRFIGRLADRMVARALPRAEAAANRYICFYDYTCNGGDVFHVRQYCCIDDYTGVIVWCHPPEQRWGPCP